MKRATWETLKWTLGFLLAITIIAGLGLAFIIALPGILLLIVGVPLFVWLIRKISQAKSSRNQRRPGEYITTSYTIEDPENKQNQE
ncbi:MAG: hypothetical protein ACOC7U_04245 [Spirochaetota bacterium]